MSEYVSKTSSTPCGIIDGYPLVEGEPVYEQAAIEAWESIKAWNTRAERTCRNTDDEFPFFECSECGCNAVVGYGSSGDGLPNYCPNCGAKVVD